MSQTERGRRTFHPVVQILLVLFVMGSIMAMQMRGATYFQVVWLALTGWLTSAVDNLVHSRWSFVSVLSWLILLGGIMYLWENFFRVKKAIVVHCRSLNCRLAFFMLHATIATISLTGFWVLMEHDRRSPQAWRYGSNFNGGRLLNERHTLRNIGFAMKRHEEYTRQLPGYFYTSQATPQLHSWQTHLLGYLDYAALEREIHFDKAWDDPVNKEYFSVRIGYLSPYSRHLPDHDEQTGYGLTHISANAHLFARSKSITLNELSATDGNANTILAGTITENLPPWGKPGNWRDPGAGIDQSPYGFGSEHDQGAQFLMTDGSVRLISRDIDPQILKALSTPNGGEPVLSSD